MKTEEDDPVIACPRCSRPNPASASFCHHDGSPLTSHPRTAEPSRQTFAAPFTLPCGRRVSSFEDLVSACLDDWPAGVALMRNGGLAALLRAVGRHDLAEQAREAALSPDSDWALGQLLDRLPTRTAPDAKLQVSSLTLDLGQLHVGQEATATLRLSNAGRGCLYGSVSSDVPWLTARPHFGCAPEATIEVEVRARGLRAVPAPLTGRLTIESTGGTAVVSVTIDVPTQPFSRGELAGARTPRQLIEFPALGLPPIEHLQSVPPPATTWQPLPRRRPARRSLAVALAPSRRLSPLWLLILLPVMLLALVSLAGAALRMPSGQAPVAETSLPPEDEPAELPPPTPIRSAKEDPPGALERPYQPPAFTVPEFRVVEVEVVFCIDTTGSMGGLLLAAQNKIWSICNQIAGGRPTPMLRVGLVAYRDRGDDYVTRVTDLTRDLDAAHQELLSLKAGGGGDVPESVNQALDDAVNSIKWSSDDRTLRIVFLVGDAPPHLDYQEVKYAETCRKAAEKGIVINAIQCGNDAECRRHWKEIASKAGGEYVAIPQGGGVRVVASPFDARMAELLAELMDTALIHGDESSKKAGQQMVRSAKQLRGPSAADRVAFAAKTKRLGPNDLLDDVRARRVKLADVAAERLPDELKKLDSLARREARLEEIASKRADLYRAVLDLERKRAEHVKKAMGKDRDGFDEQVLSALRKQAKKFDVVY